jgi:4-hydroxy-tetrahydrodipicolinate reductase
MSKTRVVVVGASGRMGITATRMFFEDPAFEVVGLVDTVAQEHSLAEIPVEPDLIACLQRTKPDVMLEFTTGRTAGKHALAAVQLGIATVVGATGTPADELEAIKAACGDTPCLMVPNFSIGAVLMMKFSAMAAEFLPDVEIIELHHEKKVDSPSGTAMRTAEMISDARTKPKTPLPEQLEKVPGARGAWVGDVPIHSIRLPGLLAHQEVHFGGTGELLTIRHDSMDRSSFESGIKLCCGRVRELRGFNVGMENLL